MNFFINKAMGIGNSGVEHAQFYRAQLFDNLGIPYKYIFTELVKELKEAMEHWEISSEKVIDIWEFFTFGPEVARSGLIRKAERQDQIIKDFSNTHRIVQTVTSSGLLIKEHIEKSPNPKNNEFLLVSRYKIEIFDFLTGERKIMFNEFKHPRRGRILENIHIYDFEGEHLFFRNEILFQRYFFECLSKIFLDKNTFILDRGEEPEVALFNHQFLNQNIIEVIHADHLGDRAVAKDPLWNNYYEYLLTHIDQADKIIVSTDLQREDFIKDFPGVEDKFVTIPVGGIRDKRKSSSDSSNTERPLKFMTASRLASEKHIDLAIRAFSEIHGEYPEIIFDIYGQGVEEAKLQKVINELEANDYIHLKGHSNNLEDIYKQYDAFISASYSEVFGLTYIEALNAGLPIITFKARFGALELITDGVNGYLKDFKRGDESFNVAQLKQGIYQMIKGNYVELKRDTIESVEKYQDSVIGNKWKQVLDEL